jgi:hypothetical protein
LWLFNKIVTISGAFFIHKAGTLMRSEYEVTHHEISKAAYYKYEKRGFKSGYELDDWLSAEEDIIMSYYWPY